VESKTARLTLLIDPNKKAAFERLCASQDRTASQVVRQLIRDYLAHHGVEVPAGAQDGAAPAGTAAAAPKTRDRRRGESRGPAEPGAGRRRR
jgi:hypothetical protein